MDLSVIPTLDSFAINRLADPGLASTERAVIENLRWEERVGDERFARYTQGFTGIDDPYEEPLKPELTLDVTGLTPEEATNRLLAYLQERSIIGT